MTEKKSASVSWRMGKTVSKKVDNAGDAHVTVVQTQQQHSEEHEAQQFLLYVILVAVIIQLAIKLYETYKQRERKVALKAARSGATVSEV